MMQSVEPMMMGSPTSSPTSANQSQYLPAYLLGHPAPMPTSPTNRMWSGPSHSPSKSAISANKSAAWSSPSPAVFSPPNREILSGRGKDKSGAPPVQGLLEHITSPVNTPDRKFDLLNMSSRANQSSHMCATPHGLGTPLNQTNVSVDGHASGIFGSTKKSPPSPAQIDPFYTQGESIGPTDELDETWVTIFGFPAAAASFILHEFSQYGNILRHVLSTEGNWLHIHYQSKLQAKTALSKNGKVFGSSIMVGVARCIDKSVMEKDKENSQPSILNTPTGLCSPRSTPANTSCLTPAGGGAGARHTPIRPLTAAYRAASSDQEVLTRNNTPQKNNNFISKAMEYMFGW